MKRPADERLVAMQFECVLASGGGRNPQLYAIEGVPGVFRRVARTAEKDRPEDHLLADFGSTEVELVRARDIEDELRQAGFLRAKPDVSRLRPSERRVVVNDLFLDHGEGEGPQEGGVEEGGPEDAGGEEEPQTFPASAEYHVAELTPEARERAMRGE